MLGSSVLKKKKKNHTFPLINNLIAFSHRMGVHLRLTASSKKVSPTWANSSDYQQKSSVYNNN